ncbi:hypothetical protein CTAYLR_008135 [Chrysophaeum taylorii]|uniref:Glycosyltransferase 2-like domain-containing protein n=1 Tax=Chrysophaeum taylorii TaxID=2483200 RepID=A0AAD7XNP8_9STRA|nr:hypothetical protein CTAYLR_008135 [Chrysophaeum taylorii]
MNRLIVVVAVASSEELRRRRRGVVPEYYRNTTALPKLAGPADSVAAVVLSYNHATNVAAIARHLRSEAGVGEIVVAEDGSEDGSKTEWARHAPTATVLHSKNLHEIRAYNNGARNAEAGVVCFLQDDDIPNDPGWAREVLALFDAFRHERLALLSGLASEVCQVELGEQQVEHPSAMKNFKKTHPIPYLHGNIPFMFVTEAWLSPLCVRTDVFRELGGFDETLANAGEPGIGLDIHLSLRAGVLGYTIGVHGAEFDRGVGGHGTVSDPQKAALRLRKRQEISLRIRQVAGCRWPPAMLQRARDLNDRYLTLRPNGRAVLDDIDTRCRPFVARPCGVYPFGSFALVVNNISGPGLLDFPAAFQHAGWVPSVVVIFAVASVSASVATMLCDVMARVEAEGEKGRLEFSSIFAAVMGRSWFALTQWLYFLNLFAQNVAAIVATAQATDMLIATVWGRSCAIDLALGAVVEWTPGDCGRRRDAPCAPFHVDVDSLHRESPFLVSLGYALCFVTLAPLGFVSLEENMLAQKISFILLCVLCAQFLRAFQSTAGAGAVPAVGPQYRDLLGVVMFNFAFCVTIPSWVNEKAPSVDARKVVWASCLSSAAGYVAVGWAGGLAYARASDNVLDELTAPSATFVTRICGGLFAYAIIGLGIPIFCVLMRYNLVAGNVCPPRAATFVSAWLPWCLSFMVYRGHGILALLSWSGLVLNSLVDFILPMLAVLAALKRPPKDDDHDGGGGVAVVVNGPAPVPAPSRRDDHVDPPERQRLVPAASSTISPSPQGHAPLPRLLMPHYRTIARLILALLFVVIAAGLALKIHYSVKLALRHRTLPAGATDLKKFNSKLSSLGLPEFQSIPNGFNALLESYSQSSPKLLVEFLYPSSWLVVKPSINTNGEAGTVSAGDYGKGDSASLFVADGAGGEANKAFYQRVLIGGISQRGDNQYQNFAITKIKPGAEKDYAIVDFEYELLTGAGFVVERKGVGAVTSLGQKAPALIAVTTAARWKKLETSIRTIADSFRVYEQTGTDLDLSTDI